MNTSTSETGFSSKPVRTRFAPSPTGYLHLGGARTALFSWAYARHFGGSFVLRIEDTDLKRSTPEAIHAIINSMNWLGLHYDEGPFYQMQRIDRYHEVIAQMLREGTAYYCYSSPEEIEIMRRNKVLAGEKPRYDGTWRPEIGKTLPSEPADRKPVVRFKNPLDGTVSWNDLVKGSITISNSEMDDLVIARADTTPTYNFCVAVDDLDMQITHVIRGDDHVNNTPRQINILNALGVEIPSYGHLPMILDSNGEKLSKRRNTVSVMKFSEQGYLPEAILNYLARLGWGYRNQEIFDMGQFCKLFNLNSISKSSAQFNDEKLSWVNKHYIKISNDERLATIVKPLMEKIGANFTIDTPDLPKVINLMKKRASTINEIVMGAMFFYCQPELDLRLLSKYLTQEIKLPLTKFLGHCSNIDWNKENLALTIKNLLVEYQLKMSKIAIPLRLIATGQLETPAIDTIFELLGRETVIARLTPYLK